MFHELNLGTNITITPHLLMYNKILQMTGIELSEHIFEQSHENPLIDYNDSVAQSEIRVFSKDVERFNIKLSDEVHSTNEDWDACNYVGISGCTETLYDHLVAQINALKISDELRRAMKHLTYHLDKNGFISDDIDMPVELLNTALIELRELEPAGVFALDIRDCLLLQLDRQGGDDICEAIITNHLTDLGRKHYNAIAKALGITDAEVRRAAAEILKLNPKPCSCFKCADETHYIKPDLELHIDGKAWEITQIRANAPHVRLNKEYISMLKSNDDPTVETYLKENLGKAKELLKCLEQRGDTVLSIAKIIVKTQESYFLEGSGKISALGLSDISEKLGIHESTVSRAVRGKYMLTPLGVFELNHFLSRTASKNTDESASNVMQKIKDIIANEPEQKPLSDQKIADALAKEGIEIARRTVAKYREQQNIPPATARKRV